MDQQAGQTERTRVKLCGMYRQVDIEAVNLAQPDYCGFVVNFPKSHRNVSFVEAQELASQLAEGIIPVAVVVNQPIEDLAALVAQGVITTLQLHGSEDAAYVQKLREAAPQAFIIQAFRVATQEDVALACQSPADLILLDSGQGSGQAFDWSLTKAATRPYLLAGGLGPHNLQAAVSSVHPWGVDMSSGIETDKIKDPAKMMAAVQEIRSM